MAYENEQSSLPDDAPDRERRILAARLHVRHYHDQRFFAEAWIDLHPNDSKLTTEAAAEKAARELHWFRNTYPEDLVPKVAIGMDQTFHGPNGDLPGDLVIGDNGEIRLRDDAPNRKRRGRAAALYMRHHFEGLTQAEAWFALHPDKRDVITADSAKKMCYAELRWLALVYPMDGRTLMEAHDLGYADVAESIRKLKDLTTPLKKRIIRTRDEAGNIVEEIEYIEIVNARALEGGIKLQMQMLGLGAPAKNPVDPLEPDEEPEKEPDPIPKTIEEAKARGKPITIIEHPPEISQEEWQRKMDAIMEEKRQRGDHLGDRHRGGADLRC